MLLGNHEAMTMLGNESYCSEGEYLSFATTSERLAWPGRVARATRRIYQSGVRGGMVSPFQERLALWQVLHVPGRRSMRRALGPHGRLGRALRALPIIHQSGGVVFVHGGLLPRWARLGVDGVNHAARAELADVRRRYLQFPKSSIVRSPEGPLWDRSLTSGGPDASKNLRASLRLLGAERMIVGHTPTSDVKGGSAGRILIRHGGRLVLVDVGLGHGDDAPRTALLIEGGRGIELSKEGTRTLWDEDDTPKR
jgi:hypothetical protein